MKRYLILILALLAIVSNSMASQEMTLEESIRSAIENNKELQAARKGVEIASWQEKNALTNFLPKAYLNTTAVRLDDNTYEKATELFKIPVISETTGFPTGDFIPFSAGALQGMYKTSYRTNIVVQQPLFMGGKIALGYQISRLANDLAGSSYQMQENETVYQVTNLYLNILKLNEMRDLTNKSITSTRNRLQQTEQLKELGMAREADLLQWQVRLQDYRQSLLDIDNNIAHLVELWNTFSGTTGRIPAKIDVTAFQDEIAKDASLEGAALDSLIDEISSEVKQNSPALGSLELGKQIAKRSHRMAQGNFLPTLSMQFSYEIDDGDKLDFSGNKSWNIAAVFSLPLFTGGDNYTRLQIAAHQYRQNELSSAQMEELLLNETRRVVRNKVSSAKNVTNRELNLTLTRANYDTLDRLHRQGMLTNQEMLDAESMLRAGEMQYTASIYDYIIAKYELGKLGVDIRR